MVFPARGQWVIRREESGLSVLGLMLLVGRGLGCFSSQAGVHVEGQHTEMDPRSSHGPCSLTIAQSGLFYHIAPVPRTLDTGPHTEEVACTGIEATDNGACLLRPVHVHP